MSDAITSAFVEIVPDFQGFARKANSEMTSILGSAGDSAGIRAGSGVSTGVLGGIGKLALPIAGAFAALGIGRIVGDLIAAGVRYGFEGVNLASDLSETRSAVEQVFGSASSDIQKFASSSAKNLGQTEQQALAASQTFGVFGSSAGLAGKDLSVFSTDLVGLSADFASFYNTSPQEAIDAIGAGLRGEAEPLRKYGVLLDDASLKAKALELGIYDGNGSLTSQQRILAANASIFGQSNLAQGDFARTSGGLANQQRILAASFEEAKTKLGTSLLPAMTTFVGILNDKFLPILTETIDKVGPVLGAALTEAAPAFGQLLIALAPLIPPLIDVAVNLLPPLIDLLILISPLLIDWAENTAASAASMKTLFDLLGGDITLQQAIDRLLNLGGSAGEAAGKIGSFVYDVAGSFARFAFEVGVNIGLAKAKIEALPGQAVAALAGLGATLYSSGRSLIQGFINGISSMLKPVTDAVDGIMSRVAGFFPNSPAKYGPFSGSGWTNLLRSGAATFGQFSAGFEIAGAGGLGFAANVDVGRMTSGRPTLFADSAAAPTGGRTPMSITNHITTPPNEDPRIISKGIARELVSQMAG